GETRSANMTLPVGSSSETVTVSATALQVNTQTAANSTLINSEQIVGLPLNNRNYEQLVGLQPGVAYGGGDQLYIGLSNPSGQTDVVSFSTTGQENDTTLVWPDGFESPM